MMTSIYEMSVRLSLVAGGFGTATAVAANALRSLQAQAALTQTQITSLSRAFGLFAGGAVLTGLGLAGLDVLKGWVSAAADLQSAMMGVQLASTGTAAQLAAIQNATFTIASKTQFSAPDIAQMAKIAATNGLNNRAVLLGALPELANVSELNYRLKGADFQSTTAAAIQMAHLFLSYPTGTQKAPDLVTGKPVVDTTVFNEMLNLVGRAQLVAGNTMDQMARTLTYLAPLRSTLGQSPQQMIALAAVASNVGLAAGRGGASRIMALFRQIAPTGTAKHDEALARLDQLGGGSLFTNGQFVGIAQSLDLIMKALTKIPDQAKRMLALRDVFGASGMTAASVLASSGAIARFQQVQALLGPNGLASVAQDQQQLNKNTLQGQLITLSTNLHNLSTILGGPILQDFGKLVTWLVNATAALQQWLLANPAAVQAIARLAEFATALALVVGPILMLAGLIWAISTVIDTIAPVAAAIAEFLGFVSGFAEIAAIVVILVAVFLNWKAILDVVGGLLSLVGKALSALWTALNSFVTWVLDHIPGYSPPAPTSMAPQGYHMLPRPQGTEEQSGRYLRLTPQGWVDVGPAYAPNPGTTKDSWTPPHKGAPPAHPAPPHGHKTPPPPPPQRFHPGIGGGGRIVVEQHFHGIDNETHRGFVQSVTAATIAAIEKALSHDEYYGGMSLNGSLEPGIAGY